MNNLRSEQTLNSFKPLNDWLEEQFNRHFKRLNRLTTKHLKSEKSDELLFLKCDFRQHKVDQQNGTTHRTNSSHFQNSHPNGSPGSISKSKSPKRKKNKRTKYSNLINWFTLNLHNGHLTTTEKTDGLIQTEPTLNYEIDQWLRSIEACVQPENGFGSIRATPFSNTSDDLICIVLTKPSDRKHRESVIYTYPPESPSSTDIPLVGRLSKLCGMFITLLDVIQIFASDQIISNVSVSVSPESNQMHINKNHSFSNDCDTPSSTEYNVSFVHDVIYLGPVESKDCQVPLLLMLAMPASRHSVAKVDFIAELIACCIQQTYGSLGNAFKPYFTDNQFTSKLAAHRMITRIISVLHIILVNNKSDPIFSQFKHYHRNLLLPLMDNHSSSLLSSSSSLTNLLISQKMSLDMSVSQFMNDFASLDWLTENISFYKNNDDIEMMLSEHFARCMRLGSSSSKPFKASPSESKMGNNVVSLLPQDSVGDNNNLTDLLELELSMFSMIGLCLFDQGTLVKSHLPGSELKTVQMTLFTYGFLTLSRHTKLNLVYFVKVDPVSESDKTNQYLMVIGHEHILVGSLIQVHNFNGSLDLLQQPSSFAFYVFIKESFRLLHFYMDRLKSPQCSTQVTSRQSNGSKLSSSKSDFCLSKFLILFKKKIGNLLSCR